MLGLHKMRFLFPAKMSLTSVKGTGGESMLMMVAEVRNSAVPLSLALT